MAMWRFRMKCFYHNDADGKCAAAIVKLVEPECKMISVQYSKDIEVDLKRLQYIEKNEPIIIVDFSFKPEVMNKLLKITQAVVWIDHHKTAMEYVYDYKYPIPGSRSREHAACLLTWKYFMGPGSIPDAIRYISDRDNWNWKFGKLTAYFNEGLKLYDHEPEDEIWSTLLQDDHCIEAEELLCKIMDEGRTCIKFRDQICKQYHKSFGFSCRFIANNKYYTAYTHGLGMFGSESFGDMINEYDICVSFSYKGKEDEWIISIYSNKDNIDCSKIAESYGGGGHKGAAGFLYKGDVRDLFLKEEV